MSRARINPSILSADFANFESEFATIANSDLIHVDVMDNNFVPNLTFGLPMVQRMQQITPKPLDIHLMIANVDKWAAGYAETGAFSVTFHAEASDNPVQLARRIRAIGARAGVAIKPGTNVEGFLDDLSEFDQLLVMTVEPGFGGQALIEDTLTKVSAARRRIDQDKLDVWLQVDGGIDETNIQRVAELGADTFVAGSAVFKSQDRAKQIQNLRDLAEIGISHRH
ncbi:ribulose-phosphate 3-epimerase [Rhodoluna lacicola]|jgi:ribulose-phosphate 3-epimerase|uniref:ribulose-phosphate 3-epimerase n=1 Tax=Rhodoluna lacicola TaxID=529884 RepID=UPI002231DB24|nr:ribulose-phosphate 3-epimerase [Rhodoluna lacicola]BDS50451.1 ribulose-phosphate 3-epimerase [Rhodoluna lacicola]